MTTTPCVLSIAGTDPTGGAGIQADIKTFGAHRTYGMGAMTAVIAQSTQGVVRVDPVPAELVRQQVEAVCADIPPDAVKLGMLTTAQTVRVVESLLHVLPNTVLDPVMASSSGHPLVDDGGVEALRSLAAKVDLLTPNLPEAALILQCDEARTVDEAIAQAHALRARGTRRVLLKGGHFEGDAADVYVDDDGVTIMTAPRIPSRNTHGTGCALSSSIAALVPQRPTWLEAVRDAKDYVHQAIRSADALNLGHGNGPLHHLHPLW